VLVGGQLTWFDDESNRQRRLALRPKRHPIWPQGEHCDEPSHREQEHMWSGVQSSPRKMASCRSFAQNKPASDCGLAIYRALRAGDGYRREEPSQCP
jgi:hypothetical protein